MLELINVKPLNRAIIADGKMLQYYVFNNLNYNDSVLIETLTYVSANTYQNDLSDSIHHYVNGVKDYNLKINDSATLSAYNNVDEYLKVSNISNIDSQKPNVITTNLSAYSDFIFNTTHIPELGNSTKFVDAVSLIQSKDSYLSNFVNTNQDEWSSISAINVYDNSTQTPTKLVPSVLYLKSGNCINFSFNNNVLTINYKRSSLIVPVSNHCIDLTQI